MTKTMNPSSDEDDYIPSLLNPRTIKRNDFNCSLTQNSVMNRSSLSLRKNRKPFTQLSANVNSVQRHTSKSQSYRIEYQSPSINNTMEHTFDLPLIKYPSQIISPARHCLPTHENNEFNRDKDCVIDDDDNMSAITISSDSNIDINEIKEQEMAVRSILQTESAPVSLSFKINDSDNNVQMSSHNGNVKKIFGSRNDNDFMMEYDIANGVCSSLVKLENAKVMTDQKVDTRKRCGVIVNIEIKKKKVSDNDTNNAIESEKVLFLNTDALENVSNVIVQPPNCNLVKRQILDQIKFKGIDYNEYSNTVIKKYDEQVLEKCSELTQHSFCSSETSGHTSKDNVQFQECNDTQDMSKASGVNDAVKCDRTRPSPKKLIALSPQSTKISLSRRCNELSPKRHDIKSSTSDAQRVISPKARHDITLSAPAHRKNTDSFQFSLPGHLKDLSPARIPYYKIIAGTHFAVDAFSYGDIKNVKHHFLTHFHSDHYAGLKKSFNKTLFCSKITADLCISRLGVNPKCIQIIRIDETVRIEGVEVTAVDANHCPGAIMLIFTLPNGRTVLHTGDFRASPTMESYPVFWNKDIYTIYLDTTYCNPRYDFPTQDQSLEMALYLLRQKKMAVEKAGKKFSMVLIVCGTYTIGKEKFFLGMARRVGCTVWACPEKDRVLQTVEGRSFSHAPPRSCQLHVVPMRDLTHEKLRSYLDSLQGAFSEVVAFKPSGWENGKNSTVEKDLVTIHGIPYSEHSSFSELVRFVSYLKPKQVVPTVDVTGGIKSVQKFFPCPLVNKEDVSQTRVSDYFSIQHRQKVPAVT